MGISIITPGNAQQVTSASDILRLIKEALYDLEDQLNRRAEIYSSTNNKIPSSLKSGDIFISTFQGVITFQVRTSHGMITLTADMVNGLMANGTYFKGYVIGTTAPTVAANFPNQSDWGFYTQTGTGGNWLCMNMNGVLKKVAMT